MLDKPDGISCDLQALAESCRALPKCSCCIDTDHIFSWNPVDLIKSCPIKRVSPSNIWWVVGDFPRIATCGSQSLAPQTYPESRMIRHESTTLITGHEKGNRLIGGTYHIFLAIVSGNMPTKNGQLHLVQYQYLHWIGSWRSFKAWPFTYQS